MKKLSAIAIAAAVLLSFVPAAAEPAVLLSLAAPSAMLSSAVPGSYDLDELDDDSLMLVALPSEILDSGFSLSDALSGNFARMGSAAMDAMMIAAGFNDFIPLSASGSISFVPSEEIQNGKLSLDIIYSDASLLYRAGSRVSSSSVSGTVGLEVSFFSDPLLSIRIGTEDLFLSSDTDLSGEKLEIILNLNREAVDSYYGYLGLSREELRPGAAEIISLLASDEGIIVSPEEIIGFCLSNNADDILDAAAFIAVASSDPELDELSIASMLIVPTLLVNGEESEDIDLEKAMRMYFDLLFQNNVFQDEYQF